jgi:hypothetical protein
MEGIRKLILDSVSPFWVNCYIIWKSGMWKMHQHLGSTEKFLILTNVIRKTECKNSFWLSDSGSPDWPVGWRKVLVCCILWSICNNININVIQNLWIEYAVLQCPNIGFCQSGAPTRKYFPVRFGKWLVIRDNFMKNTQIK